jgi:chromosome partitioning protein
MIYTVGGIKGGSGKTTIATNLTIALVKSGREVILVDADDQESATDFTAFRHQTLDGDIGYTAVKITGSELNASVVKLAQKYDDVVIDTGGRDTVSQRSAVSVSHVYLIPFAPRSLDIWTLGRVEKLIAEIKPFNQNLVCLAFINKADARGSYKEEASELLKESKFVQFIDASIGNRISFANSVASGLSVLEFKPTDQKAILELKNLMESIEKE